MLSALVVLATLAASTTDAAPATSTAEPLAALDRAVVQAGALALAQDAPPPPAAEEPPPPPPVEAPPPPAAADPPPATYDSYDPPAQPAPPAAPAPSVNAEPPGMNPFLTGLVQFLSGCGTGLALGCITAPCAIIPYVGACVPLFVGCVITPGAVGTVETIVGDLLGQKRGALLWPVLATYGAGLAAGIINAGVSFAVFTVFGAAVSGVVNDLAQNPNNLPAALAVLAPVLVIPLATSLVLSMAVYATPAIVYQLTAEPKKPGDPGGFHFPGFTSPNHPGQKPIQAALPRGRPALQAMAY